MGRVPRVHTQHCIQRLRRLHVPDTHPTYVPLTARLCMPTLDMASPWPPMTPRHSASVPPGLCSPTVTTQSSQAKKKNKGKHQSAPNTASMPSACLASALTVVARCPHISHARAVYWRLVQQTSPASLVNFYSLILCSPFYLSFSSCPQHCPTHPDTRIDYPGNTKACPRRFRTCAIQFLDQRQPYCRAHQRSRGYSVIRTYRTH